MKQAESERYWDERARENAMYYVDNEVGFSAPDAEAFWRRGAEVVETMCASVGFSPSPEDEVVDIGCGIGRLTRALAARVRRVYGLDVSREMLEEARRHNADVANVEWVHGDGAGLSVLSDASVDGCFSHVVFQHIPDPAITLNYVREMGRVLRPGGWALFQVSSDPSVHMPRRLARRVKAFVARGPRIDHAAWWGSAIDMTTLRAAAEEGGLVVEQVLDEGSQFTTVFARRATGAAR
jgi:ubiquinone/menaquinone biosynthesis C-methylase UbiE